MNELDKALINFFQKKSDKISDKNCIPVDGNVKFVKYAFDMYKVYNDHYNGLWKLEDVNGKPHLVRTPDILEYSYESKGDWTCASNYDNNGITLSYKNVPIQRFSSDEYGFNGDDILTFKSALLDRANNDNEFVSEVLTNQPKPKFDAITATFPELKNYFIKV